MSQQSLDTYESLKHTDTRDIKHKDETLSPRGSLYGMEHAGGYDEDIFGHEMKFRITYGNIIVILNGHDYLKSLMPVSREIIKLVIKPDPAGRILVIFDEFLRAG